MSDPATRLILTFPPDRARDFFPILQKGFVVKARVGCTLQTLLCGQWGIAPEYVATRITTIFLDGKATDDVNSSLVRDGATVALSGAMPGLVGATMRRGGHLAAMRSGITHRESAVESAERIGSVRVKLFNLLLPELGPAFLQRGVRMSGAEATDYFRERDETFWAGCEDANVNGAPVAPGLLRSGTLFESGGAVSLTVNFRGTP